MNLEANISCNDIIKLPNKGLKSFAINNCNISSLWLGVLQDANLDNQEIAFKNKISIIKVENCLNLKNIFLGENKIESLDLSSNLNLETINVYGNNLTDININNLTKIKNLSVATNNFTTEKLNKILQFFIDNNITHRVVLSMQTQKTNQQPSINLVNQFLNLNILNLCNY